MEEDSRNSFYVASLLNGWLR